MDPCHQGHLEVQEYLTSRYLLNHFLDGAEVAQEEMEARFVVDQALVPSFPVERVTEHTRTVARGE